MGTATMVRDERSANLREAQSERTFPWERLPGESIQAYRRFMAYRLMPPGERSLRKLEVHYSLANRWSKRWQWTKRTAAYDDWVSESIDGLSNQAQLGARYRAARLGSAFARQAERKLSEVKLETIEDLVNLAESGVAMERRALAIADQTGETRAERAPLAQVAISLGSTPPWLTGPANDSKVSGQTSEIKPLVLPVEQVLAGESSTSRQAVGVNVKRLAEKIVKSPKAGNK